MKLHAYHATSKEKTNNRRGETGIERTHQTEKKVGR